MEELLRQLARLFQRQEREQPPQAPGPPIPAQPDPGRLGNLPGWITDREIADRTLDMMDRVKRQGTLFGVPVPGSVGDASMGITPNPGGSFSPRRNQIRLNQDSNPHVLAHELGHAIAIGKRAGPQGTPADSAYAVRQHGREGRKMGLEVPEAYSRDPREMAANLFAAQMLTPDSLQAFEFPHFEKSEQEAFEELCLLLRKAQNGGYN